MTAPPSSSAVPISAVTGRVYVWIGVALSALGVVQLLADRPGSVSWVALVGALVTGAAVALMPRTTIPALLGLFIAITGMVVAIDVPVFASFVAVMVTSFTLARYTRPRIAALGYAVLVGTVAVVAAPELEAGSEGIFGLIYPIFYFGGAALLGFLARKRAEHVRSLVAYAEVLEREHQQRVELAAAAERERLARDMHDVVSHGVSLMVLQAEAAREVLHTRPDDAATALDAIADAGRTAMSELHRMMGVLRRPGTDLEALVASVRSAGLRVDLQVAGEWATIPEATRSALYRVAQESLTNTMRHASGAEAVTIVVDSGSEAVRIEVVDDGRCDAGFQGGSGNGLRGLKDRLVELGGDIVAGPLPDGAGYRVAASVPDRGAE